MKPNSKILEEKLSQTPSGVFLPANEVITLIIELKRLEDKEAEDES